MNGPWTKPLRGQLDEHVLVSDALRDNPLGDPNERPLWVYTPPSYAGGPAIYVLQGFTGQIDMWGNRAAFRLTFLELLDAADIDARVVFVDAWTSVGGSQFVDSTGSGRYHTYICEEIVSFVDERYETNGFRGVAGKSSGGQGAAVTAMRRPISSRGSRATLAEGCSRSRSGRSSGSRRDGCATPTAARSSASSPSSAADRRRSRIRTTSTSCSSGASPPPIPPTRTGRSTFLTTSRPQR